MTVEKPKPNNYSDQSQQEHTALWTNHNSQQLTATRAKHGKNHAYVVRVVLALLLIGRKTGASLFSQSLRVAIATASLLSTVIWKLLHSLSHNMGSSWVLKSGNRRCVGGELWVMSGSPTHSALLLERWTLKLRLIVERHIPADGLSDAVHKCSCQSHTHQTPHALQLYLERLETFRHSANWSHQSLQT